MHGQDDTPEAKTGKRTWTQEKWTADYTRTLSHKRKPK